MRPVLTIVVGLIAAVVVLWLILLICFATLRPPGTTLRDAVRIVPDAIRLVHRLARDHDLNRSVRIRLLLLLGYLALPSTPSRIRVEAVRRFHRLDEPLAQPGTCVLAPRHISRHHPPFHDRARRPRR